MSNRHHSGRKGQKEKIIKDGTHGFQFNQLVKTALALVNSCPQQQAQEVLRRQIKKLDEFDDQNINYMEVISHWILPKLYYLQERSKQVKGVNLHKLVKHKTAFIEKIKNGLRNYDNLKFFYQQCLDAAHIFQTQDQQIKEKSNTEENIGSMLQKEDKRTENKPLKKRKKKIQDDKSSSSSSQNSSSQSERYERSRSKKSRSTRRSRDFRKNTRYS